MFCFHPDTLVVTADGPRRIGSLFERGRPHSADGRIRVFDRPPRVVTREGRVAQVAKAFRHHYSGDLLRIKAYNCPPMLLTPEHRVFTVSKHDVARAVRRVRADQLGSDHLLVVPERASAREAVVIDARDVIGRVVGSFRTTAIRMPRRKLAAMFEAGGTSEELAAATGYHAAYLRKLRGRWKRTRETFELEAPVAENRLVLVDGRVRFKTEKKAVVPATLRLDERLAWLLGFYCAEGHVTTSKDRPDSHRLAFSFGHRELARAEPVQSLLGERFGVEARLVRRRTTYTVEIGSASLALLFGRLCGTSARSKRVPSHVVQSPRHVIQAFLDGVIDGDGCDRGTHQVVSTVSDKLGAGLFELGLRLGVLPSWHR